FSLLRHYPLRTMFFSFHGYVHHRNLHSFPTRRSSDLKGNIRSGQKVLVYGASGAIGTTAVQLAKYLGAEVTGVCSTTNLALVKSLGADKMIDYTREDSISSLELYDFVLDAVGRRKSSKLKVQCKTALTQNGKYISVDGGMP